MWNDFVQFWDSLGWIANFLAICAPIVAIGGWFYRRRQKIIKTDLRKYKNISGLVNENVPNKQELLAAIKNNAKIAIVDDEPTDFPLDYLRDIGFNVDVFEEVSLADYEKFSRYTLVLLDISGVVKEDRNLGGLEFIKRLDSLHLRPKIIAVSSKKFDPKATTFFNIADDKLNKPINEQECEDAIIDMLTQKLSPHNLAEKIDKVISESNLNNSGATRVYKVLLMYINGMKSKSETICILKKRHAFLSVDSIVNDLEIIKGCVDA